MNIADLGHAFARKPEPQLDRDDPVIAHAIAECCTYVVDVMYKIGIRNYDATTARRIAREMIDQELDVPTKWARYLRDTAPQMQADLLVLLSKPDSES
jgi:hypothetical protein